MESFTVGERMMIYRRRLKLTKAELAKRAGVSVSTVTKYENDEVSDYDIDTLLSFSIVLGVSINKLLLGIEDPQKRMQLASLIKQD